VEEGGREVSEYIFSVVGTVISIHEDGESDEVRISARLNGDGDDLVFITLELPANTLQVREQLIISISKMGGESIAADNKPKSIRDLSLSFRTRKRLEESGVVTIAQMIELTTVQLNKIVRSVTISRAIVKQLAAHGLHFRLPQ
jgi:hypothetical protein